MKLLAALVLAASLHADAFEGSVTYKVTNPKGRTHTLVYSMKGEKTRVDMATPKSGNIGVIVDNASKKTLILMDGKKTALQRPLAAEQHHPRGGLQEHPIGFGDLVGAAHEHATRLVELRLGRTAAHQSQHLVLQRLEIAAGFLVQEHQVYGQPVQAPELVRQQQLRSSRPSP